MKCTCPLTCNSPSFGTQFNKSTLLNEIIQYKSINISIYCSIVYSKPKKSSIVISNFEKQIFKKQISKTYVKLDLIFKEKKIKCRGICMYIYIYISNRKIGTYTHKIISNNNLRGGVGRECSKSLYIPL